MDKDTSWRVVDERRVVVADLLDSLGPDQWATPSLCDGWTVRDVGAHLSMAATSSVAEVVPWVIRSRGSFDRMIRDSAIDRARRPTDQIVADLRGIVGSRKLAPSTLWRDPLLDAIVHAHDIARPLGRHGVRAPGRRTYGGRLGVDAPVPVLPRLAAAGVASRG